MHLFEFDPAKSASNREKHGIDFMEAQAIWLDPDFIEIPAKSEDENRFLVVGKVAGKYWSAIGTHRQDKFRIISVRRSRQAEVAIYES